jgi:hypothetical protein
MLALLYSPFAAEISKTWFSMEATHFSRTGAYPRDQFTKESLQCDGINAGYHID